MSESLIKKKRKVAESSTLEKNKDDMKIVEETKEIKVDKIKTKNTKTQDTTKAKKDVKKKDEKVKKTKEVKEAKESIKGKISGAFKKIDTIRGKIEKIDIDNFDEDKAIEILKLIDKEIEKSTTKLAKSDLTKESLDEETKVCAGFAELNDELISKLIKCNPFELFVYSKDKDKDRILKDFFEKVNKDIHWLDLKGIDFDSDHKTVIKEKTSKISNSLIKVLEDGLNVTFSSYQKAELKNDLSQVVSTLDDDYEGVIKECEKIKEVSSIKLVTRPSYKNFISKSELREFDPSKKISTVRVDFLNFVTAKKIEKEKMVKENIKNQLIAIREIYEQKREEIYKKMKLLFILIALSLVVTTFLPAFGALGIITIGSAAAFYQSKLIFMEKKTKKIEEEIELIENNKSNLIDNSLEKLNEISEKLLEDENCLEVVDTYIRKKKEKIKEEELRKKVEKQIIESIILGFDTMNKDDKDLLIKKTKETYNQIIKNKDTNHITITKNEKISSNKENIIESKKENEKPIVDIGFEL